MQMCRSKGISKSFRAGCTRPIFRKTLNMCLSSISTNMKPSLFPLWRLGSRIVATSKVKPMRKSFMGSSKARKSPPAKLSVFSLRPAQLKAGVVVAALAALAGGLPADAQHRRAYSSYSSGGSAQYKPSYQPSHQSNSNFANPNSSNTYDSNHSSSGQYGNVHGAPGYGTSSTPSNSYNSSAPAQTSSPSTNYYSPSDSHSSHSDPPIARPGDNAIARPVDKAPSIQSKKGGLGRALKFLDNQMNKLDAATSGSNFYNTNGFAQQNNIYHPPGGFSKTGKLSPNFFTPAKRTGGYEADLQQRIMDAKGNSL